MEDNIQKNLEELDRIDREIKRIKEVIRERKQKK